IHMTQVAQRMAYINSKILCNELKDKCKKDPFVAEPNNKEKRINWVRKFIKKDNDKKLINPYYILWASLYALICDWIVNDFVKKKHKSTTLIALYKKIQKYYKELIPSYYEEWVKKSENEDNKNENSSFAKDVY